MKTSKLFLLSLLVFGFVIGLHYYTQARIYNPSSGSDLSSGGAISGNLTVDGNVGIGTSTPNTLLDVHSTATTTVTWDSSSASQGACIKVKDMDGDGYT